MSDLHAKLAAKRNRQVSDTEADAILEMAEESTDILINVAKANGTRDTKAIIQASSIYLEHVVSGLTGDKAREFLARYNAGERIVLDATYAQVLDEKATLEEQVADLQKAASGDKPRLQLGGGSDPLEQAKAQLDAHPEYAQYVSGILGFILDAVNNGATQDDLLVRAGEAGKIMLGEEDGYKIVQGAPGTAPTIKMVADARAEANIAKQALLDERNVNVAGSLKKQLEDAKQALAAAGTPTTVMPAGAIMKTDVSGDVNTLVGTLTGAGRSVRVDAIKATINSIADTVNANKLP